MKSKVKIEFSKDFEQTLANAATESIKINGIDITCPKCHVKFFAKGESFDCPNCSTHFSLEQ